MLQTFINKLVCQVSTPREFLCCHHNKPCSRFLIQSVPGFVQRNYNRPCHYLFVEIIWYSQHLSLTDLGVRHWFLPKFSYPFVGELQTGMSSFNPKWLPLLPPIQSLFKFLCLDHPRSHPKIEWQCFLASILDFRFVVHLRRPTLYQMLWESSILTVYLLKCHWPKLFQECLLVGIFWFGILLQGVWEWGIDFALFLWHIHLVFEWNWWICVCYWFSLSNNTVLVCKMVEPILLSSRCYGKFNYTSNDVIVCLKQYEEEDNNQTFETHCI